MAEESLDLEWIQSFATRLGIGPLTLDLAESLLSLAGDAARDSGDRRNAPVSCFLAGVYLAERGLEPSAAVIESLRESA